MITEFRAVDPASGAVDGDLFDVAPLRDAFERFASGATLKFRDPDGTKISEYPYGTRVEVQYNTGQSAAGISGPFLAGFDGGSQAGFGATDSVGLRSDFGWKTRGAFTTLEPRRTTSGGTPIVSVDAVGYSHYLTREQIITDYTDKAKSAILNDIITTFTPVGYNASKVDVADDSNIDLSLRGITPAEAISQVASQSADEQWFVDTDFEFVFESQDIETAPNIGDADVIDYDLPEKGARSINKFTVYWGANEDNAWVEEDREAQQELADQLGVSGRVVVADSDAFPEITTESEAEARAKKRLGEQAVIQTGTVSTPLTYFGTESGDVFSLTISEAGITGEDFRVAQHDYEWGKGRAVRTIAENTGDNVEELLVSLSESLTNERLQNVAPDATVTNALRIDSGLDVDLSATIIEKTTDADTFFVGFTHDDLGFTGPDIGFETDTRSEKSVTSEAATRPLLNLLRDLWADGESAFIDLTHLSLGTGSSDATRADDTLVSEVGRIGVDGFGTGGTVTTARLRAAVPAGGIFADGSPYSEVGVQDAASGGDLFGRLTTDDIDVGTRTRVTLSVSITLDTDPDAQGVVTTTGQERWRDLLIGESDHEPTTVVYGDGTTTPSESDTALANQIYSNALDSTEDGSTGEMTINDRIDSNDTSTGDISELGEENSAGELLARSRFEAYGEPITLAVAHSFTARND